MNGCVLRDCHFCLARHTCSGGPILRDALDEPHWLGSVFLPVWGCKYTAIRKPFLHKAEEHTACFLSFSGAIFFIRSHTAELCRLFVCFSVNLTWTSTQLAWQSRTNIRFGDKMTLPSYLGSSCKPSLVSTGAKKKCFGGYVPGEQILMTGLKRRHVCIHYLIVSNESMC